MTRTINLPPPSIDAAGRSIDMVWLTGAHTRRNLLFCDPFDEERAMDSRAVRLDLHPVSRAPAEADRAALAA